MIAVIFIAITIGAVILALDSFQGEMSSDVACAADDAVYDATTRTCGGSATDNSTSTAFGITDEGLEGTSNATSYLSTIGTLIGVAALIAIVVGAFMYVKA